MPDRRVRRPGIHHRSFDPIGYHTVSVWPERPVLPEAISDVELIGLRVGRTRLDLAFRQHAGLTAVNVMRRDGAPLDVVVRY
jgi:hypothetical protein